MRSEHDVLGRLDLPKDCPWGIHTARALANHPISGRAVSPRLIRAYAQVKLACAQANGRLGHLPKPKAEAIAAACDELFSGRLTVPALDAYQGGAGTSTNLMVSEVLAHRAAAITGVDISATDDVNRHQSTNDTYQAATRIAAITAVKELEVAVTALQEALHAKEHLWADVVALGRTEGMDAAHLTMGRRLGAWAEAVGRDRWRLSKAEERLRVVALGGTAIGTGVGAPRDYVLSVVNDLRSVTGLNLARAENLLDGVQNADALVEVHGLATALASTLLKMCGDLRFLSTGPQAGLAELRLPARQAGSSIMPGKINPVVPEAVTQAALRVLGNHQVIAHAAGLGQLELNPFAPLLAETLLESLDLLTNACQALARDAIAGLEVDRDRCFQNAQADTAMLTALVGFLGYEAASALAKDYRTSGEALQRVAARHGVDRVQWEELTKPASVLRLGNRKLS